MSGVDQVYTKIILNFHKTEIHPCVLRRNSGAFQEKKNPICTNMREQKSVIKITISKPFICMGQLLVSQEKENWLFSKLVVVGQRFPTNTSEHTKHYSLIC